MQIDTFKRQTILYSKYLGRWISVYFKHILMVDLMLFYKWENK